MKSELQKWMDITHAYLCTCIFIIHTLYDKYFLGDLNTKSLIICIVSIIIIVKIAIIINYRLTKMLRSMCANKTSSCAIDWTSAVKQWLPSLPHKTLYQLCPINQQAHSRCSFTLFWHVNALHSIKSINWSKHERALLDKVKLFDHSWCNFQEPEDLFTRLRRPYWVLFGLIDRTDCVVTAAFATTID